MNVEDISTVRSLLSKAQNIVVVPHKNPDGDAIGSCLGLYHFLKQKGLQVQVVTPNDYPRFLKWMPGNDTILNFEKENSQAVEALQKADLIFTLDFNHFSRQAS